MTQEQWKPITRYQGHTFDGKFEVSSWGNVRQKQTKKIQPFYSDNRGQGYLKFKIYDTDKKRVAIKVSRLVAQIFIGEGGKGYEIDHIDGNVKNNSISNLRWVTHKENMKSMSKGIKKAKETQEENTCKYCGRPISAHLFCCRSCWKDFEAGNEEENSDE